MGGGEEKKRLHAQFMENPEVPLWRAKQRRRKWEKGRRTHAAFEVGIKRPMFLGQKTTKKEKKKKPITWH